MLLSALPYCIFTTHKQRALVRHVLSLCLWTLNSLTSWRHWKGAVTPLSTYHEMGFIERLIEGCTARLPLRRFQPQNLQVGSGGPPDCERTRQYAGMLIEKV